jgi:hypothetical protein
MISAMSGGEQEDYTLLGEREEDNECKTNPEKASGHVNEFRGTLHLDFVRNMKGFRAWCEAIGSRIK